MVLDEPWKVGTSAVKKVDITEHSNRYCCESVLRLHADDYLCLGNQVRNAFSLSGIQPQHYSIDHFKRREHHPTVVPLRSL
jgi:hypothetical protein